MENTTSKPPKIKNQCFLINDILWFFIKILNCEAVKCYEEF